MFTARKTLEWPDQSKDKEQTKHGVIHGKSTPTDLLNQLETWLMSKLVRPSLGQPDYIQGTSMP